MTIYFQSNIVGESTMWRKNLFLYVRVVVIPLIFIQCNDYSLPPRSPSYSSYQPILTDRTSLDKIAFTKPEKVINAGKVYVYNNYVLLNEVDKGFHIIDNTDPVIPVNIGFLSVIASHDAVIRQNVLYCDNATDLISIDVTDFAKPKVVGRIKNVFPEQTPPDGLPLSPENVPYNKPANTVIISWRKR
ncbi:MAG: hypothetical protein JNJ85_00965 [Candidatus Kapabacteria bacterium]|nr:hypothetical protein [Candidatus Kapabacteria bacterium]